MYCIYMCIVHAVSHVKTLHLFSSIISIFNQNDIEKPRKKSISMLQGIINSARSYHSSVLNGVMRSPMSFFDTTPSGRGPFPSKNENYNCHDE